MLAFSNDYYGMIFRATQSVELFCAYIVSASYADVWSYYLKNEREVSMEYVLKDIINGVDDLGLAGEDTYFGVGAVNLYKSLSNLD